MSFTRRDRTDGLQGARTSTSTRTAAAAAAGPAPSLKIFQSDWAHESLPEGHKFPMQKYRLVRQELEGDLSLRGRIQIRKAPLILQKELELVHDKNYIERVFQGNLTAKENRA